MGATRLAERLTLRPCAKCVNYGRRVRLAWRLRTGLMSFSEKATENRRFGVP